MPDQTVIEGWKGVMVELGMGRPIARGVCATLVAGMGAYCAAYPNNCFHEDGSVRSNFFLMPLAVGTAVFLFT